VEGEGITLESFEREVSRFEASRQGLGIDLATLGDYRTQVLQTLIDRRLMVQAAERLGLEVTDSELNQRLQALAEQRGGPEGMGAWLVATGYTADEFATELREEILAARWILNLTAGISGQADQVHARHILVGTQAEAEDLLAQLAAGADFAQLARLFSLDKATRPAGGDLGWFPAGQLTTPEIEQAAFALHPGETSGVIQTVLGFHIVQVIEAERRPLPPEALVRRRVQAVEQWLVDQRQRTEIEILVGG
jgi:parvulin-like peptidyl-prolyl isomerase